MSVPVAIAGATGYTGRELIRLVLAHPSLDLAGVFASPGGSNVGKRVDQVFPELRGRTDAVFAAGTPDAILACSPQIAFLCTPHEASATLAPALMNACPIVADLSGAFRMPAHLYPEHYGFEHPTPDLLDTAVYALPERNRGAIAAASLLSCPGCYPTASLLPALPARRGRPAGRRPHTVHRCRQRHHRRGPHALASQHLRRGQPPALRRVRPPPPARDQPARRHPRAVHAQRGALRPRHARAHPC